MEREESIGEKSFEILRFKGDGSLTAMSQAIHFRSYLVNRLSTPSPPPIGQGGGSTSLRSISAINISAYGRLEEFHESSEAREAKLSAR